MEYGWNDDTLAISKMAFEDACERLPPNELTVSRKASIAQHVLHRAARGERDPVRLRDYALAHSSDAQLSWNR